MEDRKSSGNDIYFLCVAGLFFAMALMKRIQRWYRVWILHADHQLMVAGFCGLIASSAAAWIATKCVAIREKRKREMAVTGPAPDAVYCGKTIEGEDVFTKPYQRVMHAQVIGTTVAGKTESVVVNWGVQDIEQGRGLILIDGKADRSLLDKLWAYTVKAGRQKDFRLFSLSNLEESQTFNPLIGGSPEEIAERVFNSFEFENQHYRSVQFEIFAQVIRIFTAAQVVPTFLRLHQAISNPHVLFNLARRGQDSTLKQWAKSYRELSVQERAQRTSGLTAALSHFAFGQTATLFNTEKPGISLSDALAKNQIIYFQLPVLLSAFLGKATGKLVLQCLQNAVANRHRGENRNLKFFSVFLDDFSEYLYPGFVSVLNKSRSANIGVVFAHQALGDIQTLGDAVANSILTCSNIKVFMRGNDPDSAEYFSKVIGTVQTTKYTERRKKSFWREEGPGICRLARWRVFFTIRTSSSGSWVLARRS